MHSDGCNYQELFFKKVKYSDTLILHLRIHSKRKKKKEQEEILGDDGICLLPWLGDGFMHMSKFTKLYTLNVCHFCMSILPQLSYVLFKVIHPKKLKYLGFLKEYSVLNHV